MRVHGANDFQDASIAIKFASGTIAYRDDFISQAGRTLLRRTSPLAAARFRFDRLLHCEPQRGFQALHLSHRSRSNFDPHAGRLGNGVYRGAAANYADIERSLRRRWQHGLRERMNGVRQNQYRVRHSEVTPGVSAGTANDNFETAAAQSFRYDCVGASAIKNQAVAD